MDRDDVSISSSAGANPKSAAAATASPAAVPTIGSTIAPASLSRSVSQQSTVSSRSHRSRRNGSRRGSSRVRIGLPSQASSTTSSGSVSVASADDNKSLTSFPSFSPELPSSSSPATRPRLLGGVVSSNVSLVDSLLSTGLPPPPMVSTSAPTGGSSSNSSAYSSAAVTAVTAATAATSATTAVATTVAAARSALFDDTPPLPSSRVLPGSLHLTDDAHLARLIGKHGAVALVRQLAEDLAVRDAQVTALRARAADRERFLRKMLQECGGLSSLDVETRLRAMEQEQEARLSSQSQAAAAAATGFDVGGANGEAGAHRTSRASSPAVYRVSDLVSDAMADDNSLGLYRGAAGAAVRNGDDMDPFVPFSSATIRAASRSTSASRESTATTAAASSGATRGWKDYLWGATASKKASQASSVNGDSTPSSSTQQQQQQQLPPPKKGQSTVVRARLPPGSDRRTVLADDVFRPPLSAAAEAEADGAAPARKSSLASMALRLVGAGGNNNSNTNGNAETRSSTSTANTVRGRTDQTGSSSLRSPVRSARAATLQGGGIPPKLGPRSLMTMRRTSSALSVRGGVSAPQHIPGALRSQVPERWGEMSEASPGGSNGGSGFVRPETYGPVEMDTILPLEVQPPTLTHMYNRYNREGYLIDRFGFIYDQRRKRREREAAQMARLMKRRSRHSETLSMGRSGRSTPSSLRLPGEEDAGDDDDDRYKDIAVDFVEDSSAGENGRPQNATAALDESLVRDGADDKDGREGKAKRWQDYLKIATFPTELLSHTPAMSDTHVQVITDDDNDDNDSASGNSAIDLGPKSPMLITADGRGFAPSAMTTTTTTTTTTGLDTDSIVSGTAEATTDASRQRTRQTQLAVVPAEMAIAAERRPRRQQQQRQQQEASDSKAAMLVKEDVEPVRLLLQQLSELHDALQRERTVRWNEFLRKVRAERRREGEAAAASAAAMAEARFLRATAVMPETRLADGEIVGVAGLGNKGKLGRAKWNEFRALVLGGIPVALRAKIWAECTGATSLRIPGGYEVLEKGLEGVGESEGAEVGEGAEKTEGAEGSEGSEGGEGPARAGAAKVATVAGVDNDILVQIQADIHRTLTDNIFFRAGPGAAKLRSVLLAYARRNPEVGYCQGMNLIAANLLLVTPSAADAFWLLASIVETILPPGYYDHSLAASRADQQVLRGFVGEVLPRLSAHLDALAIDLETMTFPWFLSVFTDCLSAEALFRVWDVVFCLGDGSAFLFSVALALLKLNEAALLRCDTPAAVYTYINHQMTNHAISIDGLIQASEALRRLVRRDDVEARRARAMAADRVLVAERAAALEAVQAARRERERERQREGAEAGETVEETADEAVGKETEPIESEAVGMSVSA